MVDISYQNDPWFIFLYNIHAKWVPIFLNHRFWTGMTTTQRVESMNNFMNKFLRKKSILADFIVHFHEALLRLFEKEHEVDHESIYKTSNMITILPLEHQFMDLYTPYISFINCRIF
jgi:hypothetical protein